MSRAFGRRLPAAALAVVVALPLAGCSAEEAAPRPRAEPSESLVEPSDAPTLEVEPVTTSGNIVGRLPRADRRRVERAVSRVAVRWLEAAYLGGRYPRRDFSDAFPGFSGGARSRARDDLVRMSNKAIGHRIDGVTPTGTRVRVDLLAVDQRAVAGTAHVAARFRTEGRVSRTYRVAGRLMMTRGPQGWTVFAYEIARSHVGKPGKAKQDAKHQQEQKDKKDKKDRRDRNGKGDRA